MTKYVYIVGYDHWVEGMFRNEGYQVSIILPGKSFHPSEEEPDLICFTGGEDICPETYNEVNQDSRGCSPRRDAFEVEVYNHFVSKVPMVGICRGAQLFNVLNGGKMIQDHGYVHGPVDIFDYDGARGKVYACHHQGILSHPDAALMWRPWQDYKHKNVNPVQRPVYAFYYKETKTLGVQWHPEWGHKPSRKTFFELIDQHIFKKDETPETPIPADSQTVIEVTQ